MKILAISLAYPPLAYPRSVQVARLLRHADVTTVLFCADEPGARLDETIEPTAEAKLEKCIRITVPADRIGSHVDRLAHRFAPAYWRHRNLVPDRYGKWRTAVLERVLKFIDDGGFRPDAIVTFAQPFTDHLIGLELRKRLKVPWLAHFSDPWSDNPFTSFDKSTHRLNRELERSVAETADALVFTSSETVDLFFDKYPRRLKAKARVLPHCFDPEIYGVDKKHGTEKIIVRYLGNFYGRRSPQPLANALQELDRRRPGFLDDVSFELIGSGDAEDVMRMSAELPDGLIKVRPSVPYRESIELMSNSEGLLIIDAPAEVSVFLPSKLVDYIGSRRPILGITPPGTAASLVSEIGGIIADPSNVEEIAAAVERFIDLLRSERDGSRTTDTYDAVRERFTAKRVGCEFRSMLETLVGGTG